MNGTGWWFDPPRQQVLSAERHVIDGVLANVFGYHGLWITPGERRDDQAPGPFSWLSLRLDGDRLRGPMLADVDAWPWQSRSFDVVVLQHVLDQTADSAAVLEEVSRVLSPSGLLLLTQFSPLSLLAVQLKFGRRTPAALRPLGRAALRRAAAAHGLTNLGWRPCFHGMFGRPVQGAWAQRGGGSAYLALLRKQRSGLVRRIQPRRVPVSAASVTSASRAGQLSAASGREAA